MKILFLFCDMLRANLLRTFNDDIKQNGPVDDLLEKIGGTAFRNCYTPGPDSPRSLACLYSGLYPKKNGCNTRIKWPKFYLKHDVTTLLDLLSSCNFKLFLSAPEKREQTGCFPPRLPPEINIYHSNYDMKNALKLEWEKDRDLFSFITLVDYHCAIDDYGAGPLGDHWGQKHISNYLSEFFTDFEVDLFDFTFIFSDHGCKLASERKEEKKLFLTNDDRTKIVMFVRRKGDKGIEKNDKLTTIMDIYPTIQDILETGNKADCDGISLFDENGHDNIVIEDHRDFNVTLDQVLENWAVRTKDYFYFASLEEKALFKVISPNKYEEILEPDVDLIDRLEKQIEIKSCSYRENKKQYGILKYYAEMSTSREAYSDGEDRIQNARSPSWRLKRKIFKNKYKRW